MTRSISRAAWPKLIAFAVAAATVLATAAVGSAQSGATAGTARQAKDVTLTWWDYFGYSKSGNDAINGLIARYEKTHPGVTIRRTSYAYPDLFTKLNQAVATKKVPDIIGLDAGTIPSYAAQGALVDLTSRTKNWPVMKKFFPGVRGEVVVNGRTYGVPFRSNSLVLWYNRDLLSQAGISSPPATWSQLRADAKKLTDSSHSGICFPATKDETGVFPLLSFLWEAGSDVQKVGDSASISALTFVNDLMNTDGSAPKSLLQWSWDDVAAQFTNGTCAMMINGPWVYGAADAAKFKWGVAMMPAGKAGRAAPLGGEAWVIGKNSKNAAQVWDLIQWLSNNKNSFKPIMAGVQSFPVRSDQLKLKGANWSSIVPTVAKQVKVARSRAPYGTKYNQISAALQTMEQDVLTGAKSPADAAAAAKAAIQPLLPAKLRGT
jgi:multiple sugar transport system substrate-binding protein